MRKARRSLNVARRLLDDGECDFAVSRAYHAMFYVAQAFLAERELRFSKHSGVIAAFGREFAKEDDGLKEFHRGLADAQDARAIGDYQAEASISGEEVEAHVERAERFLQTGV